VEKAHIVPVCKKGEAEGGEKKNKDKDRDRNRNKKK